MISGDSVDTMAETVFTEDMTNTASETCGICCEPATHMIASEGWDGPACGRHALHVERQGDATVTRIGA